MLWAPPLMIASASPWRICMVASPIAWVLAAQAVRTLKAGPVTPNSAARCDSTMLDSCSISRYRSILWKASSAQRTVSSRPSFQASTINEVKLSKSRLPSPLPRYTPRRERSRLGH
jgi:hypothetical protein